MERGAGLHGAVAEVRRHLEHEGPASSQMLLSAYGNGQSDDIHLPLRKRRQFLRRLATSQRLLSPPPPVCWSRASTAWRLVLSEQSHRIAHGHRAGGHHTQADAGHHVIVAGGGP